MKFEPLVHRTDEWYNARLGKPTASNFSRIIGAKGQLKVETAKSYEAELIAERIFGRRMQKDISNIPAVRYGIEHEDAAAQLLEDGLGVDFLPGGFFTDDAERYGASPDRLIHTGNTKATLEIKCPEIPMQIKTLLYGLTDDYYAQVQGQLLISGYDVAHFVSYRHDTPPFIKLVERDPAYINALAKLLDEFCDRLEANHQRALKMGAWDAH